MTDWLYCAQLKRWYETVSLTRHLGYWPNHGTFNIANIIHKIRPHPLIRKLTVLQNHSPGKPKHQTPKISTQAKPHIHIAKRCYVMGMFDSLNTQAMVEGNWFGARTGNMMCSPSDCWLNFSWPLYPIINTELLPPAFNCVKTRSPTSN